MGAWRRFFFEPQSPAPLCLFRILYGMLIIADLLLLRPDWMTWMGPHGLLSPATMRAVEAGPRPNLFLLLPASDAWVNAFFWFFLLWAALLAIGCMTRLSSIVVFVCLYSMQHRNLFMLSSGDTLLRVTGFFLMFAPAGAMFSVDRLIRIWNLRETADVAPRPPWAQRMIQFELALLYVATFCTKMEGPTWRDGTALWYVYHLDQFQRFPLPAWVLTPLMVRLQTWLTLMLEFSLGTLVWVRRLRYPILLLGVALHLSIEYSMNIPLFEWIMMATYVTFLYPEDLARFWKWIAARFTREPVTVLYDGSVPRLQRMANLSRALDVFGRLRLIDLESGTVPAGMSRKEVRGRMLALRPEGPREGFAALLPSMLLPAGGRHRPKRHAAVTR